MAKSTTVLVVDEPALDDPKFFEPLVSTAVSFWTGPLHFWVLFDLQV
jgi:hypothetical protein